VATAHQKDDNAETVLHRLLRGTGFRGLGGIQALRVFGDDIEFVRPLLCVGRDEIVEYLKERNLKWQTDRTNYDCTYRRNYIRHRLIPALQRDCSGCLVEELFELSQSTQQFYSLVCSCAEKAWPVVAECGGDSLKLNLRKFLIQPAPVRVELIRRSLAAIGSGERDLTQGHFERVLQLAEQKFSGKRIQLPDGFVVCSEYESLIFARSQKPARVEKQTAESVRVDIPGQTRFGDYLIEATVLEVDGEVFEKFKLEKSEFVEWFDLDKVKPPLVVRFRRAGDSFRPLGLAGEKRVGKFLTAAKIPRQIREKILIVADAEKIIWLWPIRISEEAKINGRTQNILQLRITDNPSA
jgi:tRNA(Ile)-lysidine synthase